MGERYVLMVWATYDGMVPRFFQCVPESQRATIAYLRSIKWTVLGRDSDVEAVGDIEPSQSGPRRVDDGEDGA